MEYSYDYDTYGALAAEELEEALDIMGGSMIGSGIFNGLLMLVFFIFTAIGLYAIAKRRGIDHAWMAWVPVLNSWTLGCISDQYQYLIKGKNKKRRTVLLVLGNELDVLALGDDTASSLGMPVKRMRTVFLVLAAMLAGAAVSFTGLLGFVGLIVPHAVRRIAGSDNRYLLPLCALAGGAFVTLCDVASRVLFAPYELPVGIVMSVIGGPVFLILLLNRKGGHGRG